MGLKPDKDKMYICYSWKQSEVYQAFLCANGKCTGLYPNPNFPFIGHGYAQDDTEDFDNPNYNCRILDDTKKGCNKEGFKKCMMKFINTKGLTNDYPYNYLTHNCRTTAGTIAFYAKLKMGVGIFNYE